MAALEKGGDRRQRLTVTVHKQASKGGKEDLNFTP